MFSWIPGLSTIKSWLLGGLAAGLAVTTILWKASQLGRVKDKVKGINRARNIERDDAVITVKGLEDEKKAINDIDLNDDNRLI